MQEQTGAMAQFETDQDADLAGYTPIHKLIKDKAIGPTRLSGLVDELYGMNRKQRRAWASQQRKSK